jgi:hypothetical protein
MGLAALASPVVWPHGKPGVKVPVSVPVVESTVKSTTEPSWLIQVDRPAGIV